MENESSDKPTPANLNSNQHSHHDHPHESNASEKPVTSENVSASSANPAVASSPSDADNHKAIAIIGYIIPILFFLPLLSDAKKNHYAKFHANQQLNLLLFWVALSVIGIVPILGWLVMFIGWIFGIVLLIMGIINAANGSTKQLPLIGKFELIK